MWGKIFVVFVVEGLMTNILLEIAESLQHMNRSVYSTVVPYMGNAPSKTDYSVYTKSI